MRQLAIHAVDRALDLLQQQAILHGDAPYTETQLLHLLYQRIIPLVDPTESVSVFPRSALPPAPIRQDLGRVWAGGEE